MVRGSKGKGAAALLMVTALAACGGGGGAAEEDNRVSDVTDVRMEEGADGRRAMVFRFRFEQPSTGLSLRYRTASTGRDGGRSTGSALGGSTCEPGVDYIAIGQRSVVVPRGARSADVRVEVCGDTVFEPTETFALNWSAAGQSGAAIGTIINDDPGGLNGTGVAGSFGRDSDPLTNDDADGRAGFSFAKAPAAASFLCTRDLVTGLLWEGKTAAGLNDGARTYSYAELAGFIDAVNAQALCGASDWRLPTPQELESVVDAGVRSTPTVDTAWFPGQRAARYWSATSYRDGLGQDAWSVDFATGMLTVDNKASRLHARLVSGGAGTAPAAACTDSGRFVDHGDGTVTDGRTGLMWKRCAESFAGSGCSSGSETGADWSEALALPARVNADARAGLGYADWRLPTRAELSSLAQREQCFLPALQSGTFPNTGSVGYWSATPYAFSDRLAWAVDFADGQVAPVSTSGSPSSAKRVRLVRAGQ